jgi:glycosyltransferase involved in cell wall biosynthesis
MREALGRLVVHRVPVSAPVEHRFFDDVYRANGPLGEAALAVVAQEGRFDLIHVHDWLVSFASFVVQAGSGLPMLATIHATERGRYRGVLYSDLSRAIDSGERQLVQCSQAVITCSRAMEHEVTDYFGVGRERVRVIPNGVDAQRFDALRAADLSDFRAHYARPDEKLIFHVGRLVYEKGADLLVEAAPRVLNRVPSAKFVIAGRGPLLPALSQRVHEMYLADKILLSGFVSDDDRDRLYVAADLCVFPSRYEPFGIVALESMAAGTPVVVSDVGGLGTVVDHDQTGLTSYPENVDSLSWAIVKVLEDSDTAARHAKQALEAIQKQMTWPVIARQTLAMYRQVGGESGVDRM